MDKLYGPSGMYFDVDQSSYHPAQNWVSCQSVILKIEQTEQSPFFSFAKEAFPRNCYQQIAMGHSIFFRTSRLNPVYIVINMNWKMHGNSHSKDGFRGNDLSIL